MVVAAYGRADSVDWCVFFVVAFMVRIRAFGQ